MSRSLFLTVIAHRRSIFQNLLSNIQEEIRQLQNGMSSYLLSCSAALSFLIASVFLGSHEEFEERLFDLEEAKRQAVLSAALFRDYQLEMARKSAQTELQAAEDEYMAEKQGLREKLLASIEERRRQLKDERENLDITNGSTSV